ncbi:hypothetical protein [Roseibium sp.]|uniref:hypothetical protein n=1 Tax=Roseibium sp. TaxID=1936156 RepID=UPI003A97AA34
MHQLMSPTRVIAAAVLLIASISVTEATPLPKQTVMLEHESLAVTVASADISQADPLNSDLTIWVGEIELNDRKMIWVELIDGFGEVIYDSEVRANETHLLPDGRAVVVRSADPATAIAKIDDSRIESDTPHLVTRRVVEDAAGSTSVEFIETSKPERKSRLLDIAAVGNLIWSAIATLFEETSDRIQVAWNWLVDTVRV